MKKISFLAFSFFILGIFALPNLSQALIYDPADSAHILLSSYYLEPGETLRISGRMFAPGERVELSFGSEKMVVRAGNEGEFESGRITVPMNNLGRKVEVVAHGLSSGVTRQAELSVSSYYPVVRPSSYYVRPGGSLYFSGSNFAPNELINIRSGSEVVATVTAGGGGNFVTNSFSFPYSTGSVTYVFEGASSGRDFSVRVTPAHNPWIVLNQYYINSNQPLIVYGYGFGNGENVRIDVSGSGRVITIKAREDGTFAYQIPSSRIVQKRGSVEALGEETQRRTRQAYERAY